MEKAQHITAHHSKGRESKESKERQGKQGKERKGKQSKADDYMFGSRNLAMFQLSQVNSSWLSNDH